jgi:hypothetical protein
MLSFALAVRLLGFACGFPGGGRFPRKFGREWGGRLLVEPQLRRQAKMF